MKFFKKITTFNKSSKPAEKDVALATPSVAVISAVAVEQPKLIDTNEPSFSSHTLKDNAKAITEIEDEAHLPVKQPHPAKISTNKKVEDLMVSSHPDCHVAEEADTSDEYQKALKENIYLKEKNSLLLQLVTVHYYKCVPAAF